MTGIPHHQASSRSLVRAYHIGARVTRRGPHNHHHPYNHHHHNQVTQSVFAQLPVVGQHSIFDSANEAIPEDPNDGLSSTGQELGGGAGGSLITFGSRGDTSCDRHNFVVGVPSGGLANSSGVNFRVSAIPVCTLSPFIRGGHKFVPRNRTRQRGMSMGQKVSGEWNGFYWN